MQHTPLKPNAAAWGCGVAKDGPADALLQGCLSWTTGQVPVRCRPLQLILSLNELRTYLSIMQPKMRLQVAFPLSCKASACDVVAHEERQSSVSQGSHVETDLHDVRSGVCRYSVIGVGVM
jgi:hypothetical protein